MHGEPERNRLSTFDMKMEDICPPLISITTKENVIRNVENKAKFAEYQMDLKFDTNKNREIIISI